MKRLLNAWCAALICVVVNPVWAQQTPPPDPPSLVCGNCGRDPIQDMRWARWTLAGMPNDYSFDIVRSSLGLSIRSKPSASAAVFGTAMKTIGANGLLGKRVCMSATLRTENANNGAGLWCRVDGSDGKVLAFDDMQSHPVLGTQDSRRYAVVLDVPTQSEKIACGFLLIGQGELWAEDFKFEEVGASVATTDRLPSLSAPGNPAPKK